MLKEISTAYRHNKQLRTLTALLAVLGVAIIGTYLLIGSHAATPFASLNADQGSLAGCATTQTDSGGTYVKFDCGNGSTGGGNSPACSSTTRYNTVAAAAAAVASAPAGSVICMTAGSYGSITFSGTHSGTVTIEPDPAQDPTAAGKVVFSGIDITGSNITVHNFYSTGGINFKPPAIHDAADHNDVTNDPGGYGIDIDCNVTATQPGCSYITMNGNRVHDLTSTTSGDGDALRLDGWANVTITNNEVSGIEQQPETGGVPQGHNDCLQSYNANKSTHDVIFDHNYEHDNQCQGFFLKDGDVSHNVTVTDNLLVRGVNKGGADTNIYLYENTDNAILRNNTAQHTAGSILTAGGSGAAAANVDHNVFDQFNSLSPKYALTEDYNIYTDNNQWSFSIGPHSSLNANLGFMCGSSCGNGTKAGDDYRLVSNPNGIGIDWAPSQYTYGPIQ